jgi:hypothetical protein
MWWWILSASLALCGLLLFVDGRRREQTIMRDWAMVLTPRGKQEIQDMRTQVGAELDLVDLTYEKAREAQVLGRNEEALRLLECGCRLIEAYCPTMLRALAAWSVLSRMVAAMAPVKPLRPAGFRLPELVQLARLDLFVHHLVVTTGERFRLRLYILARGFETLTRVIVGTTRRLHEHPAVPDWERTAVARLDLRALSEESIEALRTLLASLDAERRAS